MPPGHIAATWGVAALLQQNHSRLARLDYRLLAVAALAPDLLDKPLAVLVFTQAHTSQLIAHSLVPHLALLVMALLLWRKLLPYALAFNGHLLADRMWHHTESFWWPFFGPTTFWEYKFMNTPQAMARVYLDIVTRYPQVWVVELAGLLVLVWFGYRFRLYRRARLSHFCRTGRVFSGLYSGPALRFIPPRAHIRPTPNHLLPPGSSSV